jgi:3-oxoacyl-[acyl-carrier-protein] synthase II
VSGSGAATDVAHLLTPEPDGRPLAHAIGAALRSAGAPAHAIDYVASHGSGTRRGDASEAHALRAVFGDGDDAPLVSSVKAATGHLGAGAGALNLAVAALAVHHQQVPPTLNLDSPDPACGGLDLVAGEARETPVRQALALARGLEGQNVALAVRAA